MIFFFFFKFINVVFFFNKSDTCGYFISAGVEPNGIHKMF
jgi:hypothetical protein